MSFNNLSSGCHSIPLEQIFSVYKLESKTLVLASCIFLKSVRTVQPVKKCMVTDSHSVPGQVPVKSVLLILLLWSYMVIPSKNRDKRNGLLLIEDCISFPSLLISRSFDCPHFTLFKTEIKHYFFFQSCIVILPFPVFVKIKFFPANPRKPKIMMF